MKSKSSPADMALMNGVAMALFGATTTVTETRESYRAEVTRFGIPHVGYGPTPARAIADLCIRKLQLFQG